MSLNPLDRLRGTSYTAISLFEHQHGFVAGVQYGLGPVPAAALSILEPAERDAGVTHGSTGFAEFVGGRLALRAALMSLPRPPEVVGALLRTTRGAPMPPPGFVASVTHKAGLALGLAAADSGQQVGVDLEALEPERMQLARRILRDDEIRDVDLAARELRWQEVLIRFSVKEAVYKAVDSCMVGHELDFKTISVHEAVQEPIVDGFRVAAVALHGAASLTGISVEASYRVFGGYIIATAKAFPRS